MKKVLFVGLNPFATAAILDQLDKTRYSASCFASDPPTVEWSALLYNPLPYSIIPAFDGAQPQSHSRLYQVIMHGGHDAVVFVGMDIWEYIDVLQKLAETRNKPFKIAAIFPYDLQMVREDWVDWSNELLDFPCVYSQYDPQFDTFGRLLKALMSGNRQTKKLVLKFVGNYTRRLNLMIW